MLFSFLNNVLSYNRVCDKEEVVNCSNFAIIVIQGAQENVSFIIKIGR